MFEFGRELKRLFRVDALKDGLTGGDASLLELLDLDLLRAEGRAADVAAGRISAKDRAKRYLEAARVWREIARRTGDVAALRKAASAAERAAAGFDRERRMAAWSAARCEQAGIALLGAELFGDDGLNAAADAALKHAQETAGETAVGPLAAAGRAVGLVAARLRLQAITLTFIDGFHLVAWACVAALLLTALLRKSPLNYAELAFGGDEMEAGGKVS